MTEEAQTQDVKLPEPVGELADLADGLGTTILEWNSERWKLPAGTKLFTADQVRAAVMAERERCARLCDEVMPEVVPNNKEDAAIAEQMTDLLRMYFAPIAAAIRSGS